MGELETRWKAWFQRGARGILGSSHYGFLEQYGFLERRSSLLGNARLRGSKNSAGCSEIILQHLAGRQREETGACVFKSSQGPRFHMEPHRGMYTNKTVK